MAETVRFPVRGAAPREFLRKSRKLMRLLVVREYRNALFTQRVAATIEHEGQPFADCYGTVIDVGANRGQFAVFARRMWPEAKLICFEPLPAAREVLIPLANGLGDTEVLPWALGSESGERRMHVSRSDDSSSLLEPTRLQVDAFPDSVEVDQITVSTRRLDDVIAPDDLAPRVLMKVDAQGAELDVLRGASEVIGSISDVLLECSLVELYAGQALLEPTIIFMRERGYHVIGLSTPVRGPDGTPLQCDVLFRREPERADTL